jgi:hypothetical protein
MEQSKCGRETGDAEQRKEKKNGACEEIGMS